MPALIAYKCANCDFALPSNSGGGMVVLDAWGTRIPCLHPGEFATAADVLGLSNSDFSRAYTWNKDASDPALTPEDAARVHAQAALIKARVGYTATCLCLRCGLVSDVDAARAKRACPNCGSDDLLTGEESVGRKCPVCRDGSIQESDTGIRT